MVTAQQQTAPSWWLGSLPEYITFQALIQQGKRPDVDFTYQSPLLGGRLEKGGVVIDFLFHDPPDLAINVQGIYFHYEFGPDVRSRDVLSRAQLAGDGTTLIFIDEDDVLRDPRYYVQEALAYRDHSRLGRGA